MKKYKNKIHIVFGTTASGKTEYAVNLALSLKKAEVINADSMQIYSQIPIITNQPTEQEKQNIPHHLFGITSILEKSDLAKWLNKSVPKIKETLELGADAILVGGTGMYLRAIVNGVADIPEIPEEISKKSAELAVELGNENFYYQLIVRDPSVKDYITANDLQRSIRAYEVLEYTGKSITEWQKKENKKFFNEDIFKIHFVEKNREEIYEKINNRFKYMVDNGVLTEAQIANKIFKESQKSEYELNLLPAYKAHGLREIISYLNKEIDIDEAIKLAQQATRNYAKRQLTWWRGWQKNLDKSILY